ncbi:hypothetical protein X777_16176 [Ooceraea biroi]|uniref:Uncharacterized protein n=1 Tax=Ooceraea biroi TaxID=2015173 RepID=A0A026WVG3_OOCBI|nr:hypothetical protein X777_16176 [Ooceraea biroi]
MNSILACTQQRRASLTVTPEPKGCKATITPPNRYWVATERARAGLGTVARRAQSAQQGATPRASLEGEREKVEGAGEDATAGVAKTLIRSSSHVAGASISNFLFPDELACVENVACNVTTHTRERERESHILSTQRWRWRNTGNAAFAEHFFDDFRTRERLRAGDALQREIPAQERKTGQSGRSRIRRAKQKRRSRRAQENREPNEISPNAGGGPPGPEPDRSTRIHDEEEEDITEREDEEEDEDPCSSPEPDLENDSEPMEIQASAVTAAAANLHALRQHVFKMSDYWQQPQRGPPQHSPGIQHSPISNSTQQQQQTNQGPQHQSSPAPTTPSPQADHQGAIASSMAQSLHSLAQAQQTMSQASSPSLAVQAVQAAQALNQNLGQALTQALTQNMQQNLGQTLQHNLAQSLTPNLSPQQQQQLLNQPQNLSQASQSLQQNIQSQAQNLSQTLQQQAQNLTQNLGQALNQQALQQQAQNLQQQAQNLTQNLQQQALNMAGTIAQNGGLAGMNMSGNQQQNSQNSMLSPGATSQDSHDATLTEKLVNELQVRSREERTGCPRLLHSRPEARKLGLSLSYACARARYGAHSRLSLIPAEAHVPREKRPSLSRKRIHCESSDK